MIDINLGKGAALKTGLRYVLQTFPDCAGVVTADADGQHHPGDIVRVAQTLERNPECLVLGFRQFDRRVPIRSRIGNVCTRALSRAEVDQNLFTRFEGSSTPVPVIPLCPTIPDFNPNDNCSTDGCLGYHAACDADGRLRDHRETILGSCPECG